MTTLTNSLVVNITIIVCVLIIFITFLSWELYLMSKKNKTLSEEVKVLKIKLNTKNLTDSFNKTTGVCIAIAALGAGLSMYLERRKEKKAAEELARKKEFELVKAVSFGWSYASFSPNKKYTLEECVDDYRNKFTNKPTNQ